MDVNGSSVWHAGGTRAPLLVKRGGPPNEIRQGRATEVVPLRATGGVMRDVKGLTKWAFHLSGAPHGTEWHDRPRESAQGHGRAR